MNRIPNHPKKIILAALSGLLLHCVAFPVEHPPRWIGSTYCTYDLPGWDTTDQYVNEFDPGAYGLCRFGNYIAMNDGLYGRETYHFNSLTKGSFTSVGMDSAHGGGLFIWGWDLEARRFTFSEMHADKWISPSGSSPGSVDTDSSAFSRALCRFFEMSDMQLPGIKSTTKKYIVLIHGWNPHSKDNNYDGDEWQALEQNINSWLVAHNGSDWQLLKYRMEADTDTGPKSVDAAINGTEAAEIARQHGYHMAKLILDQCPQIEKLHLIAHSAGSWAARSCLQYVLDVHPSTSCQMTLLDAFVPAEVSGIDSNLGVQEMNGVSAFVNYQSIFCLDNYYSDHWVDTETLGTANEFLFGDRELVEDVNTGDFFWRWEWHGHSGPIQYYADSIEGAETWTDDGYVGGWQCSIAFAEAYAPWFTTHPESQTVTAGGSAHFTVTAVLHGFPNSSTPGIALQWQVKLPGSSWINTGNGTSTLDVPGVTAGHTGNKYRVVATYQGQSATSHEATLTVSGVTVGSVPAAPTTLTALAASSSQINLLWSDPASNEAGFKIERRVGASGTWVQVATRLSGFTSYSDAGLAVGTTYSYRVKAYNSSGDSDYSNVASASTRSVDSATRRLTIGSVNPASGAYIYVGPNDLNGAADGVTPLTERTYNNGVSVTLVATANVSGRAFKKWQKDGVDCSSEPVVYVAMDANHTMTAVYGTSGTTRTLTGLTISGPSSVAEKTSEQYTARAYFSDGSSMVVTPIVWAVVPSDYATISNSGRLDAGAVSSDRSISVSTSYLLDGVLQVASLPVTIRNTATTTTYVLTRNSTSGGSIGYSPKASSYAAGTVVSLHANADDGYIFSHWSGDASGTEDDITIRMDGNRSVTAHFAVDPSIGNIRVNLLPALAATEGARWKYRNYTEWRVSGNTLDGIPPGKGYVYFKDIPGWVTPDSVRADVVGGQTIVVDAAYREILGSLQVTLSPGGAASAGARWRLDGGDWHESGTTVQNVSTGDHTVEFLSEGGWTAPSSHSVTVARGLPTVITAPYEPPPGLPIITAVIPNSGGLDGGYTVTIEGANFGPGAGVTFGGTAATIVTVESSARLTASVPPGVRYGTVDVAVSVGSETGTKVAGFSYSIPLGNNMTLVSQIGGTVGAVAASENMVYFGEGSSIVSADYMNPSAPVIRGRLPLPGMVRDIRIVGNHALVANGDFGLQIVDVSDPMNLRLVGYYDTPGTARRLGVSGSAAFIADDSGGLQVVDFSNPAAPRRIAQYNALAVWDVAITTVGTQTIACVAGRPPRGALLFDVTEPTNLSLLTEIETGIMALRTISASGTTLVFSGGREGNPTNIEGKLYDISSPASPLKIGQGFSFSSDIGIVTNGCLFASERDLEVFNLAVLPKPSRYSYTQLEGRTAGMAISGNNLFLANGSGGLFAVNVANVASPSIKSTLNSGFEALDIAVGDGKVHTAIDGGWSYSVTQFPVLTVVDVSDARHPQRQGTVMSNYGVVEMVKTGSTVYSAAWRGLCSFSIANPTAPTQTSSVKPGFDAYSIGLVNGYLAVGGIDASDRGFLALYAPSGFQTGTPTSSLSLTSGFGLTTAIATFSNTVFAFVSGEGLKVVNCANPQAPQVQGTLPMSGTVEQAAVSPDGRFVYASDGNGLLVFDCTDRWAPALAATYSRVPSLSTAPGVAVAGNLVFFADFFQVNVLDCGDPTHPRLAASYDNPGWANVIRVSGNTVYVADGDGGVLIIELGDVRQPVIEITGPSRNSTFEVSASAIELAGTASDGGGIVRVTWRNDRGGAGEATGTSAWTIPNIALASGANVITITGEDTSGNLVEDSITVVATLPDVASPSVLVTGPSPDDEVSVETETIVLSGTCADDVGVTGVTWTDATGRAGVAQVDGGAWSISELALAAGANRITVTATDGAGNSGSDAVTILRLEPDMRDPSVAVLFPTEGAEFQTAEAQLNISGEASDDRGIARITWRNSRGGSGDVSGISQWYVNGITLQPGVNAITVKAEDVSGRTSEDTISVTYTPFDADGDGIADAWEEAHFGGLQTAGVGTDYRASGIPDFLKFAFGLDPERPDPQGVPQAAIQEFGGERSLTLKYRQLMAPGNLIYSVGVSSNLVDWDYSEEEIEQVGLPTPTGDGLTEEVTIRLALPLDGSTRRFLRLKAMQLP